MKLPVQWASKQLQVFSSVITQLPEPLPQLQETALKSSGHVLLWEYETF